MCRKAFSIISALVLMLTFSSCGISQRIALDEKLHNVVEYVNDEESDINTIRYQDSIYCADKLNIFHVTSFHKTPNDGDLLLSWNGFRMGYIDMFYSDRTDSPMFIYETRLDNLYLRNNYDYMSDIFVIDGTNVEVLFFSMFDDFSRYESFVFYKDSYVELYSKNHTRIRMTLQIEFANETWYISFLGTDKIWKCSNSFVKLLNQNGLI